MNAMVMDMYVVGGVMARAERGVQLATVMEEWNALHVVVEVIENAVVAMERESSGLFHNVSVAMEEDMTNVAVAGVEVMTSVACVTVVAIKSAIHAMGEARMIVTDALVLAQ